MCHILVDILFIVFSIGVLNVLDEAPVIMPTVLQPLIPSNAPEDISRGALVSQVTSFTAGRGAVDLFAVPTWCGRSASGRCACGGYPLHDSRNPKAEGRPRGRSPATLLLQTTVWTFNRTLQEMADAGALVQMIACDRVLRVLPDLRAHLPADDADTPNEFFEDLFVSACERMVGVSVLPLFRCPVFTSTLCCNCACSEPTLVKRCWWKTSLYMSTLTRTGRISRSFSVW